MTRGNLKNKRYKAVLIIGYILLLAPFVYSVFYSMPANDDFALGITWWSKNIFVDAIRRTYWNYLHWFGQSGIFAILLQVILNPLYWFKDGGHSFGICMIVVFLSIMLGTLIAIRKLFCSIVSDVDEKTADIYTFLVALLLLTSYYYSDVYNWWSGVAGYSFMLMLSFFNFSNIVDFNKSGEKKAYRLMIIMGIITCTSLMNCVATGLVYIYFSFIHFDNNRQFTLKKIVPLLLYILSGIAMVMAPGNFDRMGHQGESTSPDYINSIVVAAYRTIARLIETVATKPWVIMLILLIVVIGIRNKSADRIAMSKLILASAGVLISAFGAVVPYVAGSNKDFSSEFTPRIYYIEDYIVFVGLAIIAFRLGQWISQRSGFDFSIEKNLFKVVIIAILFVGLDVSKFSGNAGAIIPLDIIRHKELIKESYYFWDDIMNEIENSEDEDVIVRRVNIPWCQYVYYTSLDDGTANWPEGEDIFYCGCNQGAARFYGKKSITLFMDEP